MIRSSIILIFFLCFSPLSFGQKVNQRDSLMIMSQVKAVFKLFSNPVLSDFERLSTNKIYCIICSDKPDTSEEPYIYDKRIFFDKYLKKVGQSDYFNRAMKSSDIIIVEENDRRTDIIVLFTVYKKNELALGHEGGQLGMYFKKVNNVYKFAGLETIP